MQEKKYLDSSLSIPLRVEDLIGRMTLKEKVVQLGSEYGYKVLKSREPSRPLMEKYLKNGVGQITRLGGGTDLTPQQILNAANEIQKYLIEETRLGIPAIIHEECLAGYTAISGTIFPQAIGLASTWEPDLAHKMTVVIRNQMRTVGVHQGLSPVLDIARDPRWGRTEETYGEDPYLASKMGVEYVKGLQGEILDSGVLATGKHFLGYGASIGGRNWGTTYIPTRDLLEVYAKPFEAAIREAKLGSIMNAYSEIDGLPCGFSRYILTDILRDKLGFDGMTVSDYVTISLNSKLHQIHSPTEAAIRALKAGLDVELPRTAGYNRKFVRAVKKGEISEKYVDTAVKRVLTKKFELGLIDKPISDARSIEIHSAYNNPKIKQLVKEIALKSIVLLKNDNNSLPLGKHVKSVAIIGPSADSVRNMLGDYSFLSQLEARVSNLTGDIGVDDDSIQALTDLVRDSDIEGVTRRLYGIKSIYEVLNENYANDFDIYYAKGCEINTNDTDLFAEAIEIAQKAEVVIFVGGGKSGLSYDCTSGEARDRMTLGFPGNQEELIKELYKVNKNTILVLINGRPLSVTWEQENLPAILEAWLPGEMGAEAVVDVLFGNYNPGGKLPITIPRHVGQIPLFHNCKTTGITDVWTYNYVECNVAPLYPFGYGLSYTTFEYSDLRFDKEKVSIDGTVSISMQLKNTGGLKGEEVVQLYAHDGDADVTRPLEILIGFKRVTLEPRENIKITFTVSPRQLGFYNKDMEYIIESGKIDIYVGSVHTLHGPEMLDLKDLLDKKSVKLNGSFEIVGPTTNIESDKVFFSSVSVERS